MTGSEPRRLGDSLHQVVRSLQPERATSAASSSALGDVFGRWEDIVGPAVAANVRPLKLDGAVLVVEVDDPAWSTQIRFLESTVRSRLAEVTGVSVERLEVRVARRR